MQGNNVDRQLIYLMNRSCTINKIHIGFVQLFIDAMTTPCDINMWVTSG